MKDVILFDLDGTLALVEHRFHFIASQKKDWHGYFAACVDDPPNSPIIQVCRALHDTGHEIWIVSGRSSEVRAETEVWLAAQGVPYTQLVMRRMGDRRPDNTLKHRWLVDGTLPRERIAMVFDGSGSGRDHVAQYRSSMRPGGTGKLLRRAPATASI